MGMAEAPQQRTHQIIAGAHFLHQIVVRLGAVDGGAIDFYHMGFRAVDICAHALQDVQQNAYIGNVGYIFNAAFAADQQRSRQDSDRCVFCAADGDGAAEGLAAVNFIYGQG